MNKKSIFYIILSGIMTAGAVLGWSSQCSEQAPEIQNVEIQSSENAVAQAEPTANVLGGPSDLLNALSQEDKDLLQIFQTMTEDERISANDSPVVAKKIRLVTPTVTPVLGELQNVETPEKVDVIGLMQENDILKSAKTLAFVDLAAQNAIASSNDEQAAGILSALKDQTGVSGVVLHIRENTLERLVYRCLDDSRERCLAGSFGTSIKLNDDARCNARHSLISCGDDVLDMGAVLDTTGCAQDEKFQTVRDAVVASKESGSIEADGQKWQVFKSTLNGCDVLYVTGVAADTPVESDGEWDLSDEPDVQLDLPVSVANESSSLFTPKSIGLASAAGLIMILLGIVCVRRKEESIQSDKANAKLEAEKSSNGKTEELKRECKKVTDERDALAREKQDLDKTLERLQLEAKDAETRYHQLAEQLDFAKTAFKQEQLQRMSLAEDNRRLEDALAASNQDRTNIGNPVSFAKHPSTSNLPLTEQRSSNDKKTEELQNVDINRVTAPAVLSSVVDATKQQQSQAFFDSLTDEGWDEIEDSFDAIFSNSKTNLSSVKENSDIANDQMFGVTNLLSGLGDSDTRVKTKSNDKDPHVSTETSLKPVIDSAKQPLLPTLKPKNQENAGLLPTFSPVTNNDKGMTLNGLSTIKKPELLEKKLPLSASEMATRNSEEGSGSFRPSPSWTGKNVIQDKGMDENSLLNALKRRAKDVSEIDAGAGTKEKSAGLRQKTSGAFEYNRGLSKSGVFSVTGSRVDIDPLSDTEYFKSLYEKYIETQRACGESTDKFTMEQFVSRLAREKAELMRKYKCKNVAFTVSVKGGKASLKASPKA